MTPPLRLRLRRCHRADNDGTWYLVMSQYHGQQSRRLDYPFVLEFENPLNGSWHLVEVVDDEKPD